MYKLSYEHQGQAVKSFNFENLPSIQEVEQISGSSISQNAHHHLKHRGWVNVDRGHYTLLEFKIPTVAQLQEAWKDWNNVFSYQGQRFGQYVYNVYSYEVGNSYNETNASKAYQILFESITESLDEVVDGSIHQ